LEELSIEDEISTVEGNPPPAPSSPHARETPIDEWAASSAPSDFDTDFEIDDTPLPEAKPTAPAPAPAPPTGGVGRAPVTAAAPSQGAPSGITKRTKLIATGASLAVLLGVILFATRKASAPEPGGDAPQATVAETEGTAAKANEPAAAESPPAPEAEEPAPAAEEAAAADEVPEAEEPEAEEAEAEETAADAEEPEAEEPEAEEPEAGGETPSELAPPTEVSESLADLSERKRKANAKDLVNRANYMRKNGAFTKSIERYVEALENDPTNAAAVSGGIQAYLELENTPGAITWANRLVELIPKSSGAYSLLGKAKLLAGDVAGAREAGEKALSIDRRNKGAQELLNDVEKAEKAAAKSR
jgi:hypothetical protein